MRPAHASAFSVVSGPDVAALRALDSAGRRVEGNLSWLAIPVCVPGVSRSGVATPPFNPNTFGGSRATMGPGRAGETSMNGNSSVLNTSFSDGEETDPTEWAY